MRDSTGMRPGRVRLPQIRAWVLTITTADPVRSVLAQATALIILGLLGGAILSVPLTLARRGGNAMGAGVAIPLLGMLFWMNRSGTSAAPGLLSLLILSGILTPPLPDVHGWGSAVVHAELTVAVVIATVLGAPRWGLLTLVLAGTGVWGRSILAGSADDPGTWDLIAMGAPVLGIWAVGALAFAGIVQAVRRMAAHTADIAAAEAARRTMMRGVGHDMNNRLQELLLDTAMVREAIVEGDRDRGLADLESFTHTLVLLSSMSRDLLDAALAETGDLRLQKDACDLGRMTHTVVAQLASTIRRAELTVSVVTHPAPAWADAPRLLRVMHNIVGNAIKFTPAGGTITIATGMDAQGVWWSCQDTGPGIDPDVLQHLGASPGTGRHARCGTGIGLYASTQIVAAHNGTLVYASEGPGTRVTMRLPHAEPGAGDPPAPGFDQAGAARCSDATDDRRSPGTGDPAPGSAPYALRT